MDSLPDDLDLTQAHAFALQPDDLVELLGTVDTSLTASLLLLQTASDAQALHRALHDLKGYVGLVAGSELCQQVHQANSLAGQGHAAPAQQLVQSLVPRLQRIQTSLQAYRAGIIAG